MSRKTTIVNFLNEIDSGSVKDALGSLQTLVEDLENKNDPEPIEVEIVDMSYQLLEKLELIRAALRRYVRTEHVLTGNKLDGLYDRKSGGSSALFED